MISSDGQNTNRPAPPKTSGGFNRMYTTAQGAPRSTDLPTRQPKPSPAGGGDSFKWEKFASAAPTAGWQRSGQVPTAGWQRAGQEPTSGWQRPGQYPTSGTAGYLPPRSGRAGRPVAGQSGGAAQTPGAGGWTNGPAQVPGAGGFAGGPGANSGGFGQFPQGEYTGRSTIKPPQYIDIEDTEASVNNTLARGQQAGDQRYQIKQMDRAGMSRGKGQQTAAQIQSAKEMASAANQAAETRAQDQMNNEKMRADYEKAREQEALAIAGAQFGINFAGMQAQLAQQRAAADLMFSLMR